MLRDELILLARAADAHSRMELLQRVTDLYLTDGCDHDEASGGAFEDIVLTIYPSIDTTARRNLSKRISRETDIPRGIVIRIASDVIEVADPVLRHSPVLVETDLVAIAQTFSDDHLLSISGRKTLSEAVTDVLVGRGSIVVVRSTTGNAGAAFSRQGFSRVVALAAADHSLSEVLLARRDLSANLVREFAELIIEDTSRTMTRNAATADPLPAQSEADETSRDDDVVDEPIMPLPRDIERILERIKTGRSTTDAEFAILADADRALDIAFLVQALTGLPRNTTLQAIAHKRLEPLMTIFRSVDISWACFEHILSLRARRLRIADAPSPSVRQDFEATARVTLRSSSLPPAAPKPTTH